MKKTAYIFPGQGSQFPGMGKDLFDVFPTAKEMYQQANDILGYKLTDICFNGSEETLKQTQYTQPALFVHSMIVASLLKQKAVQAAAGHSLGEFSALGFAKAFDFETGLKLVQYRGNLMQNAGANSPGTMAAIIGLESDKVQALCIEASSVGIVQPANFNSPGQIVISGSKEGVQQAMLLAKNAGAKRALELPVSGAFHSPLMQHIAEEFKSYLDATDFKTPKIPVFTNVTAKSNKDETQISKLLYQQLTHSVRWIETIENMVNDGVTTFIEIGAGTVLAGLVKRINREVEIQSVCTVEQIESFE